MKELNKVNIDDAIFWLILDEVREVEAEGGDLDAHRARMGEEAETECPSWWRYPRTAGIVMT